MDFKGWGWRDWLVTAVAVVMGLVALAAIGPGIDKTWMWLGSNSSNIASWVQAVGSIAAIAAGFGVARFQLAEVNRKDAQKALDQDLENRFVSSMMLIDAYENSTVWAEKVRASVGDRGTLWAIYASGCGEMLKHLDSINLYRIPDPTDVAQLTVLKRRGHNLYLFFQLAEKHAENGNPLKEKNFVGLERMLDKFIVTACSYKESSVIKARINAKPQQLEFIEVINSLHENWNKIFEQGISPSDTGNPQTPQQPAASQ